jgi:hypothetical protein
MSKSIPPSALTISSVHPFGKSPRDKCASAIEQGDFPGVIPTESSATGLLAPLVGDIM